MKKGDKSDSSGRPDRFQPGEFEPDEFEPGEFDPDPIDQSALVAFPNEFEEPLDAELEEALPRASFKLDLRYFTRADRCPLMVRRRARRAFELFVFLAGKSLGRGGDPIAPSHEELCAACRLNPSSSSSQAEISRLLRQLRETYQVIEHTPVKKRRPEIRLRPAGEGDPANPKHYIYFPCGAGSVGERFDRLGRRAFAAEYLSYIARYESALAYAKHNRAYWYFPLDKLAATFHISPGFARSGLQGLVELGVLHVSYGQRYAQPQANEFGRANRFFYQGLWAVERREEIWEEIAWEYPQQVEAAKQMAASLVNGATRSNVAGLCRLLVRFGEVVVWATIATLDAYPRRSLRRRLRYVEAVVERTSPEISPEISREISSGPSPERADDDSPRRRGGNRSG